MLGQVVGRFSRLCHAHCLMDNHCNLLIQTPQTNLFRGLQRVNGVYILFQVCFPPSRFNIPVSRGDCTISLSIGSAIGMICFLISCFLNFGPILPR